MKPVRDFVLIKPCPPDQITEGGLFIPTNAQERSCKAEVVEVGKGTKEIKMTAKKGDLVFHIKGAGEPIIVDNELHFLIRQNDVLAYFSNN